MAPKRASPLDEPPTASSSSSSSSSSEEEEISSEEEEEDPAKPSSVVPAVEKKPLPQKPVHATNSQPQFSSSESGSESDSDSESEPQRPISAADENVKPIASKPMQETPKATKPRSKPRSKPSATPDRSAAKRPNESSPQVRNSKRTKKNEVQVAEDSKKSGDETKKLFQRLWSEDDELAVLKGMVEFKVKKGADSSADPNAFHDFIKKSLHVDVSKGQMMDKIRRLKKKFKNNVVKGKNGGDFTKPHEQKAFELSKKIWGGERNNGGVEQAKSNGKGWKNQKEDNKPLASLKAEIFSSPDTSKEVKKMDIDQQPGVMSLNEMIRFDKGLGSAGLSEHAIKRGLDSIGPSKRAELDERWKNLQVAEMELFLKRAELIKDQVKLMFEACKSSDH